MRVGPSFLHLVQIFVLLAVPLDAFALSPGCASGGGGQKGQLVSNGRGKLGPWRAAQTLAPAVRPEISSTVRTMSGGGDDGKVSKDRVRTSVWA